MSTTLEQWQAGTQIAGAPPYDGTGIPFPLGEDGIPDLPLPPPIAVLTLVLDVVDTVPVGTPINATVTADVAIPTDVAVYLTWQIIDGMTGQYNTTRVDDQTFTVTVPTAAEGAEGQVWELDAETMNLVGKATSNKVTVTLTAADATITVTPGSTQTVASTDPNVVAEPTTAWLGTELATFTDGAFSWDGTAWYIPAGQDPDEGWTVAELKAFAADHEPPIPIPSSANKAEILAIIVAYLHAHPEEN